MAILDFQKPEKVIMLESTDFRGRFEFRPLEPGYGITVGNALRRILLNSIEGFAIASIKIEGVEHEFSTIKGVVEDVTEIVLNLKQVRFKRQIEDSDFEEVNITLSGQDTFTAGDIGKFKIISQSSIAAGVRRVEALRDKQLENYEKSLKKDKSLKEKTLKDQIDSIKKELSKYKVKPDYKDDLELSENIKNLNKQLETIKIQNIIMDKSKNVIKDKKIGSFTLRHQVLTDFPPKELRSIVDQSKKDIKEGIVVGFSTFEGKVGVAVGVTIKLTKQYDAVTLVKIASEVLGGKAGGGRKDFAQAGGANKNKI